MARIFQSTVEYNNYSMDLKCLYSSSEMSLFSGYTLHSAEICHIFTLSNKENKAACFISHVANTLANIGGRAKQKQKFDNTCNS